MTSIANGSVINQTSAGFRTLDPLLVWRSRADSDASSHARRLKQNQ